MQIAYLSGMRNGGPHYRGVFIALCALAGWGRALAAPEGGPPRLEVPVPHGVLTFVVYGDTRFTSLEGVANAAARRALVERIATENPAAVLVGGDLVYQGDRADDYATFRAETLEWSRRGIPVFPVLGNHEYRGCSDPGDDSACLQNWWLAFPDLHLRPYHWYSVSIGPSILALMLDSDQALTAGSAQRTWLEKEVSGADPRFKFILIVLHYPPVRDPVFPHGKDEAEIERYLTATAGSLRAQVVVIGSHVHNYERYSRSGVTYLVSGGGGARPVPAFRMSGELSQLRTAVNFHFLRFRLDNGRLTGTMVRFEPNNDGTGNPWSEPDQFEVMSR